MDAPDESETTHPRGLCDRCLHVQIITSGRGSTFVMCRRARTDPRFSKYPPLPLRACIGFEPAPEGGALARPDREG